ncbi:MAG TPA: protein kinase [Pirellulaceae bacterium]|nr:protein kinase [Pirellulaceae bacterium]
MPSERDNDKGVSVRDLVAQTGPLSVEEAVNYTLQIAGDLDSLRDVVHLSPSSVLVMPNGKAKLVDVELARLHQSLNKLTATGVTADAFDYISPELARNLHDADVRSGLYSLGCTFYFMLTAMPPFPEGTVLQKLLSHSSESPPDPRDLRSGLPQEVSTIAVKLMAKLPSQRYQTPLSLMNDLVMLTSDRDEAIEHARRVRRDG